MNARWRRLALRTINFWPPFFGAGIRVVRIDRDMRSIDVEMKLRFWNRNYVGTHFGGSLYSMTDPFFMLMLIENLGPNYIVWDKAASIRFRKPGRGKVRAEFRITDEEIAAIKRDVHTQGRTEPTFVVKVQDEAGDTVAEVEKVLSIRVKRSEAVV